MGDRQRFRTFSEAGIEPGHGEYDTTCPTCSPKRKKRHERCLSVNADKGTWFCHHCEWSGKLWVDDYNPTIKPKIVMPPKPIEYTPAESSGCSFLEERGITREVIQKNKITEEGGAIHFPYYFDGEVVNVKHRKVEEKQFWQEKDGAQVFYGIDDLDESCMVIVEGEIDKLSFDVAGIPSISVPSGAPTAGSKSYQSKFDFLELCSSALKRCAKFILAVDNDKNGQTLEQELSRRLGIEKCWKVDWPNGVKDANELLLLDGVDGLKSLIGNARPYPISGLVEVEDIPLTELYEFSHAPILSPGWISLESYINLPENAGTLNVITGVPGHGKSSFLDALAINYADEYGWAWGVFSPENPIEEHIIKLMTLAVGKPFREGFQEQMSKTEASSCRAWLNEHFKFILPDDETFTVDEILQRARAAVFRYGLKGLIVDPWNEINHSRDPGLNETEYINDCLLKFRRFSRLNGCNVFLVCHPMKQYKNKDGSYSRLTLYDISGSAHFRNKCDFGIVVDRPNFETNEVIVDVQKVRHKHMGRVGQCRMQYIYATGQFKEM